MAFPFENKVKLFIFDGQSFSTSSSSLSLLSLGTVLLGFPNNEQ